MQELVFITVKTNWNLSDLNSTLIEKIKLILIPITEFEDKLTCKFTFHGKFFELGQIMIISVHILRQNFIGSVWKLMACLVRPE